MSHLSSAEMVGRVAFGAVILAALVIATVSVLDAVRWINKPFPGFLINQRMAVAVIGQYRWTGPQAGLKFPDKLVAANGQPVSSLRELDAVVQSVPIGAPVTYSVERAGRILRVVVPTMRFGLGDFIAIYGVYFVAGIVYLLIGTVVFVLKPDTHVSWAFLLACLLLSAYYLTSFGIAGPHHAFLLAFLFVSTFVCAAGVHLSLFFPEPRKIAEQHRYVPIVPYMMAGLLFIPLAVAYPGPAFVLLYKLVLACMVLALVAVLSSALLAHFAASSILAKQRAKVVFFGAALALPIPALAGLGSYFGVTVAGAHILNNFSAIPVALFPASIAYAIARHNLFDVDVYIKRAVGYGVMTTLVGLMYFSTQTVMTSVLTPVFGEYRETIYPIIFALMVVFLFNPVNRRVQQAVDQIFFRKRFDYKETISAVSSVLTSMLDLEQILRQVVNTIRKDMFVDTAGVAVLERDSKACQTFFLEDGPTTDRTSVKPVAVGYDDPLLALVRTEKRLVTKYDLEEDPRYQDLRDSCLRRVAAMGASMAIPLVYHGEVSGILAVGQKKSGHFYGREDIDLLTTMADQAAVAIRNAMAHQEVVRYAEELEASLRRIQILESIKSNLTKFVPRTVQELIEASPEAPSFDKREVDCSVLFADMTGYTRLSAQLDLDQVNKLVERFFGAFLDEIHRYGGDVNETAGDGLMVIFRKRDPRKHARAAVRTAFAIQRRTREINVELASQFEPIEMKVGVNSGIAAVGATKIEGAAGTRWTYTASGPTTNIAARLAALAEGGAVVLSEETQRRLDEEFELEDLGPQSLKNVPQPVRAYRLTGQRAAQIAADVSSVGRSESGAASGLPTLHRD